MKQIKAPAPFKPFTVFLAGSIEMGAAEDWQTKLTESLTDCDVLLLNPRRDDWDSSWEQSIDNPQFREQVEWELSGIDEADLVVLHFEPDTKSPITLLELGICTRYPSLTVVHCPEGFWRKGNVDIVCAHYGIAQVDTLEELAGYVRREVTESRS